ncbi:hypothetical protein [Cytobacillus purgationiresistens]|uniref:Uncharacterized protein n=1 Tax=Cytobacillus purgationiresistens TaxID=863449 RepID=A0ABU0AR06_9BACI|nr:hypothetical protein [Cytobacillus purgationiresistens]MDQ0273716.1 hypothetical protein [Cytobacillus purgationiresistens]
MKCFLTIVFMILTLNVATLQAHAAEEEVGLPIEMIHWREVNKILPKFSKFSVLDVETGLKFDVQRRAGRAHADVQPLTVADTKTMKTIYNGKWSWKRRAIIVLHDGEWIAASMHGMPHGAGALANNFPGHFCIHFYGSTTHRTNSMDLSHKLMVLKAAGKLEGYMAVAEPKEVISAFIAGIKQQDPFIVSTVSISDMAVKNMDMVENAKLVSIGKISKKQIADELVIDVPVEVDWFIKNKGKKMYRGKIRIARLSPSDPWKVESSSFMKANRFVKK